MIRLTSAAQALALRGTIPELAVVRMHQFEGMDGFYDPEEHGHIIVLEQGDDLTQIEEIGADGLFIDDVPVFEYVEVFMDGENVVFEIVMALDSERTIALIAEQDYLDAHLRATFLRLLTPQPLPALDRRAR
jgi:hypothetical protein